MTTPTRPRDPRRQPGLATRLQRDLGRVDELILATVDHDDPLIAEASGHLVEAGGKRFRPLLTLLAAELGDGANDAGRRGRAPGSS